MASTSIYIRDYRKEVPGVLDLERLTWNFPPIESINAHKKKTFWRIYVKIFKMRPDIKLPEIPEDAFIVIADEFFDSKPLDPTLYAWINVDSGIEGGKIKKSIPTIVKSGKNLGKASATNVWTQALRDAYGIYNKQMKKSVSGAAKITTTELFPPMLAQILKDQKNPPRVDDNIPLYVQRKYNGVRTVTTLECTVIDGVETYTPIMYSRRKNLYPGFAYIKAELLPALTMFWEEGRKLYLDGEIYMHGEPLQDISGYSRREDQIGDKKYDYMIYDCFIPDEPKLIYTERKKILDDIFSEFKFEHAKAVETFETHSMEEINELYKIFLEEGFEGAMVRVDTTYHYSYNERHSKVLLKMKPTYDSEMEIVGFTTGEKGKAAEALMIICQTEDGKKFPVTPAMELPDRIALAKKMNEIEPNGKTHFENQWLGRKIIIEYDEKSKDNVPQRARTRLIIRTWQ